MFLSKKNNFNFSFFLIGLPSTCCFSILCQLFFRETSTTSKSTPLKIKQQNFFFIILLYFCFIISSKRFLKQVLKFCLKKRYIFHLKVFHIAFLISHSELYVTNDCSANLLLDIVSVQLFSKHFDHVHNLL